MIGLLLIIIIILLIISVRLDERKKCGCMMRTCPYCRHKLLRRKHRIRKTIR